ncbi:hypothetical protein ACVMFA_003200 [Bradyrhizobium liaoningense]
MMRRPRDHLARSRSGGGPFLAQSGYVKLNGVDVRSTFDDGGAHFFQAEITPHRSMLYQAFCTLRTALSCLSDFS